MTENNPDPAAGRQPSPWSAEGVERQQDQRPADADVAQPEAAPQQPPPAAEAEKPVESAETSEAYQPPPMPPQAEPSGAYQPPPVEPSGGYEPSGAYEAPRQYPRTGEQVLFGSAVSGHQYGPGGTAQYQVPPQQHAIPVPPQQMRVGAREPEHRAGGLIAGVTVLALIVGGAAGSVGGYLVADSNKGSSGPVTNSFDTSPTASNSANPAPGTVEGVAAKLLPSLVELQVRGQTGAGEGSGFVISSDGLIVTNNHVVADAASGGDIVAVFQNGTTAKATIVGRDPTSDVAVVRAQGQTSLHPVTLGRSDDLKVGQGVVAFGSPYELSGTVTSGIVSSLHRPTRAGGDDGSQQTVMDAIQTDAAINPGNSGGPLVNMQGQVIGINSAIYTPSGAGQQQGGSVGIGFAIPIDQARRTADEIVKTGKATQTVLGVTVTDAPTGGASIRDVTANGPGAKAGLSSGDIVVQLDDRKIDTSDALVAAVRSHAPGDKVKLKLSNGHTVEVTLGGQPVPTN
ncbi:S1C family serine protease [Labedaea rhizosphaerae]|nr:trypsin-like peptidase domain-containing protein [Labedaea rhizosphaerae]